jgi:hypothetical protein
MRRCAALLSVADVAAKISTVPRIAEFARAELLGLIEADAAPASLETLVVLNNVFSFDFEVLATLVRINMGADVPAPQLCRICGCSDYDSCVGMLNMSCSWVMPDLCSTCTRAGKASA